MLCPYCKIGLEKAIFYNNEVDYCPRCLGVFFEEDELRQAKDEKDKNLVWLDIDLWESLNMFKIAYGIRLCPACRLPLYEVYYGDSGIIVDVCNLCHGIWLDRGEFKKIINYLKEKSDWKLIHEYGKSLRKEFWEIFTGPESFREEVTDFLVLLKLLSYKFLTRHTFLTKIISLLPR